MRSRRYEAKNDVSEDGWVRVVFSADCDEDGNCPVCQVIDFGDCPCPGPTQDDEYEYMEKIGYLYARPLPVLGE